MTVMKLPSCGSLRSKCFLIGYMNLVASLVYIGLHLVVAAIVTDGFQCDVSKDSLKVVHWPWLDPVLQIMDLGVLGMFPYTLVLYTNPGQLPIAAQPKCYPGMLHINVIDVLHFTINLIWLKMVLSYLSGLRKNDPKPLSMFFHIALVNQLLQIMYFSYEPNSQTAFSFRTFWLVKILDIGVAIAFLFAINRYIKVLRNGLDKKETDHPPPYVEYLTGLEKPQIPDNDKQLPLADVKVEAIEKIDLSQDGLMQK